MDIKQVAQVQYVEDVQHRPECVGHHKVGVLKVLMWRGCGGRARRCRLRAAWERRRQRRRWPVVTLPRWSVGTG